MKTKIITGFAVLLALTAVYWVFGTAYVRVEVSGGSAPYTYSFYNQSSGKTSVVESQSSRLKKRLSSGSYEITVSHGNTNYFSVVKAGRLLKTSLVNAKLTAENARQFIGDNPSSCMNIIGNRLISYDCGAAYSDLRIHVPAGRGTPTYVSTNSRTDVDGYVDGIVRSGQSYYALIFVPLRQDSNPQYYLYKINPDLSWSNRTRLTNLDASKTYKVRPYKQGFLVYDAGLSDIFYYSSVTAAPAHIDPDISAAEGKTAVSLAADSDMIILTFSDRSDSEVMIWDGTTTAYHLKRSLNKTIVCGQQMICALDKDGTMYVYTITGDKLKFEYKVGRVKDMAGSSSGFLVVRQHDVLNIDTADGSGYESYSLGGYRFNSVNYGDGYYILNLTNNKNRQVALKINELSKDSDSIDKKVLRLQTLPEVKAVSIYSKYIFITPDLGPLHFDPAAEYFKPDPAVESNAIAAINQAIDDQGINRRVYSITVTR